MTDPVKEQLSACLDGELPEGELDLLLKQVGRDSELRASLGRYALIGEALRSPGVVAAPNDFARRIATAIAAEPVASDRISETGVPSSTRSRARVFESNPWLRPASGFAVAAGVAALAILGLQRSEEATQPQVVAGVSEPAPVVSDATTSDEGSYIVPANTSASGYVPAARLTNYVVAHSEYSTPLGRRSVLSGVLTEEGEVAEGATVETPAQTDDNSVRP